MRNAALPLLLSLAVFAGCASSGGSAGGTGTAVQVEVNNNLVPSQTVSVYAAQEGGTRTLLGTVMSGRTETFNYRPIVSSGTVTLVADPPGPGSELVSRPVILPTNGPASIMWRLMNNDINVRTVE